MRKTLAAVLRAVAARLDPPTIVLSDCLTMTQFAGSGLTVSVYGAGPDNGNSWGVRTAGPVL